MRRGTTKAARWAYNVLRHPSLVEQSEVERQPRDGRLGRGAAAREANHKEATSPPQGSKRRLGQRVRGRVRGRVGVGVGVSHLEQRWHARTHAWGGSL